MPSLNRPRLLALAAALEANAGALTFNMSTYRCGTAACIAGWAVALFDPEAFWDGPGMHIPVCARKLLGLSNDQAFDLFIPARLDRTRAEAVTVLHRLAETGEVAW